MKAFTQKLSLILILTLSSSTALAGKNALRNFGDKAQIVNPIIAGLMASQEKGFGHGLLIYAETLGVTHGTKFLASQAKWGLSKRPRKTSKSYDGMPSGHTASAWFAASYIRVFSDYKALSIPLYITSGLTGYSRIQSKRHTVLQVIAGAAIAEGLVILNSNLNWSKEYAYTSLDIGKDGGSISLTIRF